MAIRNVFNIDTRHSGGNVATHGSR